MSSSNQYPQAYAFMNQTGMRPINNMMPMGMPPAQYVYPPQMPNQNSPRKNQMIRPSQPIMPSPYENQMMNPYAAMAPNLSVQRSAMSKSRTSLALERKNQPMLPQQPWYPQQAQMNEPQFIMNQGQMNNSYGMRPPAGMNKPQNQLGQVTQFYQQTPQYANGNMTYQQIPMGYNAAAQNYRPQKIQGNARQSTIPTLPMIANTQMINQQMMGNPGMMNNMQMNPASYGGYEQSSPVSDRPRSSQRTSRPSSAGSQISSNGLNIPIHNSTFRTGNNRSAKTGRRTPVDKRSSSLTTHERYMKNSRGSLAALSYETYDLDDWKRQKNRDGNMKLPAGLGHTETNEWKNKHDKMARMQQYSMQVRQRAKETLN